MRIIQVTASYKPAYIYGGPTMSVAKLCESLVENPIDKHTDIEVLTTLANGKNELPYPKNTTQIVDGVKTTYFKRLTKDHSHFSPALFKALYQKLAKQNIQQSTNNDHQKKSNEKQITIIHIHAWWNLVSVFATIIALAKNAQVVITPRGTLSNYSFNNRTSIVKKTFHWLIGKPLLKRCHFHVTSKKEEQDILNLLTPKSITIIPNLVELPVTTQNSQKQTDNESLQLLFFSRVEEKKGLELLFEALKEIKFPYKLKIAGTGEQEYLKILKKQTLDFSIAQNIEWIGLINKEEKFKVLQQANLMVLPSFDENFANVVIESTAVGTPVLVTKNVGLSDEVIAKNLGWVTQNRDKESLINCLNDAYNSIIKKQTNFSFIQEMIRNDYATKNIINNYWAMYKQISAKQR